MEISTKSTEGSLRRRDLERKSEQELKELLKMQQNLLQNKHLIQSLPDKGKRISEFIDEILRALTAINDIDHTVDRLTKMELGDHNSDLSDKIEDAVLKDLQQFVNNPSKEKIVVDERRSYPNSYEFIMKKNNLQSKSSSKNFMLNRLPSKDKNNSVMTDIKNAPLIEQSLQLESKVTPIPPHSLKENAALSGKGGLSTRRLKHKYDASLEEEMYSYEGRKSHGTRLISIEESVELLNKHQQAIKLAELKRAEEMLMVNSVVKLSTDNNQWHGEKFCKYRDEKDLNAEDPDENYDEDDEGINVICDYGDADSQEDD